MPIPVESRCGREPLTESVYALDFHSSTTAKKSLADREVLCAEHRQRTRYTALGPDRAVASDILDPLGTGSLVVQISRDFHDLHPVRDWAVDRRVLFSAEQHNGS